MRLKNRVFLSFIAILPILPFISLSALPSAQAFSPDDLQKLLKTNQCVNCDLSGANLERLNLSGVNLMGANLSSATLSGSNLSNANLEGAKLQGTSLNDAYLFRANLTGANFSNSGLQRANLRETTLVGTNFTGADLRSSDFQGNNLGQAMFPGSNLSGANLSNILGFALTSRQTGEQQSTIAALSHEMMCPRPPQTSGPATQEIEDYAANIGLLIKTVDLSGVNLSSSNLQNAVLLNTDLRNIDLTGANLRSACLFAVKLTGAKIDRIDLTQARLVGTVLPPGNFKNTASALPQQTPQVELKRQRPGKYIVGTLIRAQQAYYLENERFTNKIEDLGVEIQQDQDSYLYRLFIAPDRYPASMQVGLPKVPDLPTFLGFVHVGKVQGEKTTLGILCISEKPATPMPLWNAIAYKKPQNSEPIACPKGFIPVK